MEELVHLIAYRRQRKGLLAKARAGCSLCYPCFCHPRPLFTTSQPCIKDGSIDSPSIRSEPSEPIDWLSSPQYLKLWGRFHIQIITDPFSKSHQTGAQCRTLTTLGQWSEKRHTDLREQERWNGVLSILAARACFLNASLHQARILSKDICRQLPLVPLGALTAEFISL